MAFHCPISPSASTPSSPSSEPNQQFAPRRPFNPSCPVRENTYHLYGVSLVHEPELIKAYGGDRVQIEWVDDASCNLVYVDDEAAKACLLPQLIGSELPPLDGSWVPCRALGKVGVGLGGDRSFMQATELQVRVATTADVKDLHHKGDVDSTYYQLNCERVVRRKLSYHGQEWHRKKQERRDNYNRGRSTEGDSEQAQQEPTTTAPRIGYDGYGTAAMNPLLFLRASNSASEGAGKEDLLSMVNRAEASHGFGKVEVPNGGKGKGRKRQNVEGTMRSTEEDRRQPNLPIAVIKFCKRYRLRYEAVKLRKTYRSISFGQQKSLKHGGPPEAPPWEVYVKANGLEGTTLAHAVWISIGDWQKEEGMDKLLERRVVVLVPHVPGTGVSLEMISERSGTEAKTVSVSHMQKELGFPPMVCPPFGHQFSPNVVKAGVDPSTVKPPKIFISEDLIASPMVVFDLGNSAMKITGSQLKRLVDLGGDSGCSAVCCGKDILVKKTA
ncbi:hypothetical protein Pmar_PMAR024582 [Perkinsus marinus ATCC 50983]|uniref:Uncharacterized protein n=1 Tax=Perkinsus marinus (strain ATCC 50983 / TXsc) TaxID=423536 RepID=C5LTD4_PERM5|nr:hypothetical protein Pmar_PMAR024582 [Perkinsus marinus ATCC 50983]EER00102.1 hypothetical protein Pmar_PMAR024582 [Perkinsus marinus ATCC 50983]|eukprot:XP_002767384.1 hypothetical protein Pmar_PMAR024582 [Perkinsus marinus ATCC 50983]